MIRALIIDDEYFVREGLLEHVHWNEVGVDQVEAVGTAEEAYAYIMEKKPEILLSDIRLPGMDGIRLGEVIREKGLKCRIIFISGFADRNNLKGALRLSAEDFIDKPIDIQEVEEALQKTVARCQEDQSRKKHEQNIEDLMKEHQEELARTALKHIFRGDASDEMWASLPSPWDSPEMGRCRFLCFGFSACQIGVDEPALLRQIAEKIEAEIGQRCKNLKHLYYIKDDENLILLAAFTQSEQYSMIAPLTERIRFLLDRKELSDHDLKAAVSEIVQNRSRIAEAYAQAMVLLQQTFYFGYNRLVTAEMTRTDAVSVSGADITEFRHLLSGKDSERIQAELEQIYQILQKQYELPPVSARQIYLDMNVSIMREINPDEKARGLETSVIRDKIRECGTLAECQEYTREKVKNYCSNEDQLYSENRMVLMIMNYIDTHFHDQNLSVSEIADKMNLSPAYLSTFFRNQTGNTIVQRIRDVRMAQSVRLLKNPEFAFSDIADACGYENANYWSKVFRKYYRMSPSEYREKML